LQTNDNYPPDVNDLGQHVEMPEAIDNLPVKPKWPVR
jgi:hypothetical protein